MPFGKSFFNSIVGAGETSVGPLYYRGSFVVHFKSSAQCLSVHMNVNKSLFIFAHPFHLCPLQMYVPTLPCLHINRLINCCIIDVGQMVQAQTITNQKIIYFIKW